jgi:hypothetical protein
MLITNINAVRESLVRPIGEDGNQEQWAYLTLYDQNNNIIAQSNHSHPEGTITLNYNGIEFVSIPGNEIMITLKSLIDFVKQPLK